MRYEADVWVEGGWDTEGSCVCSLAERDGGTALVTSRCNTALHPSERKIKGKGQIGGRMQEREGAREIMTTNHSNISATCPGEWPASQAVTNPDVGHIASPRAPFKVTPVPVTFLEPLSSILLPQRRHYSRTEQHGPLPAS